MSSASLAPTRVLRACSSRSRSTVVLSRVRAMPRHAAQMPHLHPALRPVRRVLANDMCGRCDALGQFGARENSWNLAGGLGVDDVVRIEW